MAAWLHHWLASKPEADLRVTLLKQAVEKFTRQRNRSWPESIMVFAQSIGERRYIMHGGTNKRSPEQRKGKLRTLSITYRWGDFLTIAF
jgi:hypothetical protein